MRAVLLLGFMLVATIANAAPNRAEIVAFLGSFYLEHDLRRELKTYGFRGASLEVSVSHVQRVLKDKYIAGHIADQVIAAGRGQAPSKVRNGFVPPLVKRGLARLPASELDAFYKVEALLMKSMPKQDCGRAVKGQMGARALNNMTLRATTQLKASTLKEYLRITHKAARLGASQAPVRLSAGERQKRGRQLFAAMQAQAAKRSNGPSLIKAYKAKLQGSNTVACDAGLLVFETIDSLPPSERHRMLTFLSAK